MAKKRGKRPGLKARSKNARAKAAVAVMVEEIRLPRSSAEYLKEVADIAEVPPSIVMAVLCATGIYQARRVPIEELEKLKRCREVMEANDPGNAREIFGPPVEAPSQSEVETPKAEGSMPSIQAMVERLAAEGGADDSPSTVP